VLVTAKGFALLPSVPLLTIFAQYVAFVGKFAVLAKIQRYVSLL
jgi:hypothetical protein